MSLPMKWSGVAVLLLFIACGCASNGTRALQPGVVTTGKMRVTLTAGWKRPPAAETPEKRTASRIYTRNGLAHDRLVLLSGVTDGETIFRDQDGGGLPAFRTEMTIQEIADLVAASIQVTYWEGSALVEASNPREQGFTGIAGFTFELEADVPGAANHHGMGGGFVEDGRLYLTFFLAEFPRYYERHAEDARQVVDSTVLTIRTIRY